VLNGVLEVWVKSGHAEAPQKVSGLVKDMEERSKEDSCCRPNVNTYNILLNCLVNNTQSTRSENAQQAQKLLERMQSGETGIQPDLVSFDIVLSAWCKAKYPDNAEELLLRMCTKAADATVSSDRPVVQPTSRHFTTVMNGWSVMAKERPNRQQPLQRIENLLKAMQTFHDTKGFDTKPTTIAYKLFLDGLSQSNDPQAPERAESILRYVEERSSKDHMLRPDAFLYNSVLKAWSRSKQHDALSRAEKLFKDMKSMHSETNKLVNVHSYTYLMSMYMRRDQAEKVQALFDEMVQSKSFQPTFYIYITLLHAWANVGNPETAMLVLQQIMTKYEARKFGREAKLDIKIFNAVLNAWLKSKRPDAGEKAEECLLSIYKLVASKMYNIKGPDLVSFSTVIKAYSFSNHPDRVRRSMDLFEHMRNKYLQSADPSIRPDLRIFVDLIHVLISATPATVSNDATVGKIKTFLDQMASDSHHWKEQGLLAGSRLAYILDRSNLEANDKAELMRQLHSLIKQHKIEIDRTTTTLFNKYDEELEDK